MKKQADLSSSRGRRSVKLWVVWLKGTLTSHLASVRRHSSLVTVYREREIESKENLTG
jgi:hypothetical protein